MGQGHYDPERADYYANQPEVDKQRARDAAADRRKLEQHVGGKAVLDAQIACYHQEIRKRRDGTLVWLTASKGWVPRAKAGNVPVRPQPQRKPAPVAA